VDPLFYLLTHLVANANDNHNPTILYLEHFAAVAATLIKELDNLGQEICLATDLDLEVTLTLKLFRGYRPSWLTKGLTDWKEREGLALYKG
jgi:hypothetical protein